MTGPRPKRDDNRLEKGADTTAPRRTRYRNAVAIDNHRRDKNDDDDDDDDDGEINVLCGRKDENGRGKFRRQSARVGRNGKIENEGEEIKETQIFSPKKAAEDLRSAKPERKAGAGAGARGGAGIGNGTSTARKYDDSDGSTENDPDSGRNYRRVKKKYDDDGDNDDGGGGGAGGDGGDDGGSDVNAGERRGGDPRRRTTFNKGKKKDGGFLKRKATFRVTKGLLMDGGVERPEAEQGGGGGRGEGRGGRGRITSRGKNDQESSVEENSSQSPRSRRGETKPGQGEEADGKNGIGGRAGGGNTKEKGEEKEGRNGREGERGLDGPTNRFGWRGRGNGREEKDQKIVDGDEDSRGQRWKTSKNGKGEKGDEDSGGGREKGIEPRRKTGGRAETDEVKRSHWNAKAQSPDLPSWARKEGKENLPSWAQERGGERRGGMRGRKYPLPVTRVSPRESERDSDSIDSLEADQRPAISSQSRFR